MPSQSVRWWELEESAAIELRRTVYDANGHAQELEPAIGRGGEASIHPLVGRGDRLVKLYHPEVLGREAHIALLRRKITTLSRLSQFHRESAYAWPRLDVFNADRRWVGFAMHRVTGRSLTLLLSPASMRKDLPHWDRRHVVATVRNLARHLTRLADAGVIVGDISPANFLVEPANAKVAFIDCDSYQVYDGNKLLPCPVVTPTHAAPELLATGRADAPRTVEMLCFSAAILFFQVLTQGVHPFQHMGSIDPVSDIRSGRCAIGHGSGTWLHPVLWERFGELPGYIKGLFIRAFRDGHATPSERPCLQEWINAFSRYCRNLQTPVAG